MQVEVTNDVKRAKFDHLFLLLPEGYPPPEPVADIVTSAGFSGARDTTVTLLADGRPSRITLVGLGKAERFDVRYLRTALYNVARTASRLKETTIGVNVPGGLPGFSDAAAARAIIDALILSDYRYDPYITVREDGPPRPIRCTYLAPSSIRPKELRQIRAAAEAIAAGVRTIRDLGNAPGNEMTPTRLAERARSVAKETGIKCTVFNKRQIEKLGMGGLLAVNRGSDQEPRFVVLEYSPARARKTVCLVGKGITFDSGGISIKPAEKMEEMKFDMCGAATVVGSVQAAAKLRLPLRIVAIFAATENLPGGSAYKPGDIITMMSGKTVEIVNTDAEGRMILADALHYAERFEPDHLIDYATLTGACVVALGAEATGLFSTDDELARKLIEAGEQVGERFWRMPAWDEYKEYIRSEWADMKNSGGRWGGAVTAAVFLKQFVTTPSWAHLDIAGTAYSDDGAKGPRGATGAGLRATIEFLEALSR